MKVLVTVRKIGKTFVVRIPGQKQSDETEYVKIFFTDQNKGSFTNAHPLYNLFPAGEIEVEVIKDPEGIFIFTECLSDAIVHWFSFVNSDGYLDDNFGVCSSFAEEALGGQYEVGERYNLYINGKEVML